MNGTIDEIITKKAEREIKEELDSRIPGPKIVKKTNENKIVYAGRYEIASNFTGSTKKYIIDLLKDKKCDYLANWKGLKKIFAIVREVKKIIK